MRRNRIGTALLALFVVALAPLSLAAQTEVTIVLIGDTHSHLDPTGPRDAQLKAYKGGIARLATFIGMTRAARPNVLAFHSGDLFQGTIMSNAYFGVPEFQLMKQLGFDAMAVGNHEFDLGPAVLAYALGTAYGTETLPLLSANLDLSAMPELGTWIQPSVIKDVGGVKVGIFGMTVPGVPTSQPSPVVILGENDPQVILQIAGQQAAALRAAGATVVLMLSHLGMAYDEAVAANVPGIDVILGGHDHRLFETPVVVTNAGGQTSIVQPGIHGRQAVRMTLACGAGAPAVSGYEVVPLDETVPEEPTVKAVVDSLIAGIEATYGDMYTTPVAFAANDVTATWNPWRSARDTAMGNLIADALRARMGTTIALTANGLISEGLYKGPLLGADIFRCVAYGYDTDTGYGFHIVTLEITGEELLKALETTLGYLELNTDYLLQVSGMEFKYDPRQPAGQRVLVNTVKVGGRRLVQTQVYTATVNEGVAALLPMMGVQVTNLQMSEDVEYLALRDYVAAKGVLSGEAEGRIRDMSVVENDGDGGACSASVAGGSAPGWEMAVSAAVLLGLALAVRR